MNLCKLFRKELNSCITTNTVVLWRIPVLVLCLLACTFALFSSLWIWFQFCLRKYTMMLPAQIELHLLWKLVSLQKKTQNIQNIKQQNPTITETLKNYLLILNSKECSKMWMDFTLRCKLIGIFSHSENVGLHSVLHVLQYCVFQLFGVCWLWKSSGQVLFGYCMW